MTSPPSIPPPEDISPASTDNPATATLGQVAGAVFWSFFGVRRGPHMQRDAVTVKPLQVVIVGVVLAAVLVFALLVLVRIILSNAG